MKNALFCPPEYFEVIDVKNPFMRSGEPVDRVLARRQWEEVRQAFARAGLGLQELPAVSGLEDMVFANNQVCVGSGRDPATGRDVRFIVPSRMRFESRRREVPYFVAHFRRAGYEVIDLPFGPEDYLEGHGDLLWEANDAASALLFAGHGFRSTAGAVAALQERLRLLGITVVPLPLADERFYHLDTCLAPLGSGTVMIYPQAFTPAALATLRSHCRRIYEVPEEEALRFACNGVRAGKSFITPALPPTLASILKQEGLAPMVVSTSEFEKSGGSVCCLKLFVF